MSITVGILNCAIKSAYQSEMYPYRVGCVCFKKKRILSYGFNQKRTSKCIPNKYKKYIETLHAEQHAIMKIKNKTLLAGSSLLVVRVSRNGQLLMARPCVNCLNTIFHFGIQTIFYSNSNGEIVMEKLKYV